MTTRYDDLQQYRDWQLAHAMYRDGVSSQQESMKGSRRIDSFFGFDNPPHRQFVVDGLPQRGWPRKREFTN